MSSTYLSSNQGRSWWSKSKSAKELSSLRPNHPYAHADDEKPHTSIPPMLNKHRESPTGLNFKTLGSAMGFKSKKTPSLAIQDPPSASDVRTRLISSPLPDSASKGSVSSASTAYNSRPRVNSIRTSPSSEWDGDAKSSRTFSEPRTPSDNARASYQPSVLTFSEIDPFAAGGVIIQQTAHDSNRLSVFSDSSMLDPHSKIGEVASFNRMSYASSSTNSPSMSSDSHSFGLTSAPSMRSARSIRSRNDSIRTRDILPPEVPDIPPVQLRRRNPAGSNSSGSTVNHDNSNRLSAPPPGHLLHPRAPGAAARPRGMTIATSTTRRPSTADEVTGHSTSDAIKSYQRPSLRREASDSSRGLLTPSTPATPSPVMFSRSRSSTLNSGESSISPVSTRPLVVVRKASSTRVGIPPPSGAPPSNELPPPPFLQTYSAASSVDDLSTWTDHPSSSSSSISFAPSKDLVMRDFGDGMLDNHQRHDLEHPEADRAGKKGKGRSARRNKVELSPALTLRDFEIVTAAVPSSSMFPPIPAVRKEDRFGHTDTSPIGSPRLLKKAASQQNLLHKHYSEASMVPSVSSHDGYAPGECIPPSSPTSKAPRKKRSFHHPRLPLPPLPTLRHANISAPMHTEMPSPSIAPSSTDAQPRRGSITNTGGPSTRKRLFSGTNIRRSTSSQVPYSPSVSGDEDLRSIYSDEDAQSRTTTTTTQRVMISLGSLGNPFSLFTNNACVAPSSYWNDTAALSSTTLDEVESKETSPVEYVPQHIMSPAEMLKLEQQLAEEAETKEEVEEQEPAKSETQLVDLGDDFVANISGRSKSDTRSIRSRMTSRLSTVSATTSAFSSEGMIRSNSNDSADSPHSTASDPFASGVRGSPSMITHSKLRNDAGDYARFPHRANSVNSAKATKPVLSIRPSTAQPSLTSPTSSVTPPPFSHSPLQIPASLPPPPRSRNPRDLCSTQKLQPTPPPQPEPESSKRASVVPMQALSPPPLRNRNRAHFNAAPVREHPPLVSRPPSAFNKKALHRRSIMKKPSFLDIEDEPVENASDEEDEPGVSSASPEIKESFLDMDRGKDSFDTIRSSDSLLYF